MSDALHPSRRTIFKAVPAIAAPAAAALLALAPDTEAALASAVDPWVSLSAAFFRHRDAVNGIEDDDEADREMDAWGAAQNGLIATQPTTVAGITAGLRAASADLYQFHIENHDTVCPGIRFVKAMMDGSIAALEQGVAHV